MRSPGDTRRNYARDVGQFIQFVGSPPDHIENLASVRPHDVAAWRDSLLQRGLTNSSVRRKLTALQSLFSYLQVYGHRGVNPAHSDSWRRRRLLAMAKRSDSPRKIVGVS